MTFDECIEIVLRIEGGATLVDNPSDNGGLTKWGIALNSHPELGPEGIRALTKAKAKKIYKADYWDPIAASQFPLKCRLAVLDTAVNHGMKGGGRLLQKSANSLGAKLLLDGQIGPVSIAAIKKLSALDFLLALSLERLALYERHEDYAVFGRGWKKRIFEIALHSA